MGYLQVGIVANGVIQYFTIQPKRLRALTQSPGDVEAAYNELNRVLSKEAGNDNSDEQVLEKISTPPSPHSVGAQEEIFNGLLATLRVADIHGHPTVWQQAFDSLVQSARGAHQNLDEMTELLASADEVERTLKMQLATAHQALADAQEQRSLTTIRDTITSMPIHVAEPSSKNTVDTSVELRELQLQLEQRTAERDELQSQQYRDGEVLRTITQERNTLNEQIQSLTNQLEEMTIRLREKQQENRELRQKNKQFEQQAELLQGNIAALEVQLTSLQVQLVTQPNEHSVEALRTALLKRLAQLERVAHSLDTECTSRTETIADLDVFVSRLQLQLQEPQAIAADRQQQIERTVRDQDWSRLSTLSNELTALSEQMNRISQELEGVLGERHSHDQARQVVVRRRDEIELELAKVHRAEEMLNMLTTLLTQPTATDLWLTTQELIQIEDTTDISPIPAIVPETTSELETENLTDEFKGLPIGLLYPKRTRLMFEFPSQFNRGQANILRAGIDLALIVRTLKDCTGYADAVTILQNQLGDRLSPKTLLGLQTGLQEITDLFSGQDGRLNPAVIRGIVAQHPRIVAHALDVVSKMTAGVDSLESNGAHNPEETMLWLESLRELPIQLLYTCASRRRVAGSLDRQQTIRSTMATGLSLDQMVLGIMKSNSLDDALQSVATLLSQSKLNEFAQRKCLAAIRDGLNEATIFVTPNTEFSRAIRLNDHLEKEKKLLSLAKKWQRLTLSST